MESTCFFFVSKLAIAYSLPLCAAGTNFLIRSKAFQECGWSPEYTLTEDFALGMELKMRQWQVCALLPA